MAAVFGGAFAIAMAAHPCSTPVFQYALEHWPADPYQLTIRHHGLDEARIESVARAVFLPEKGGSVNIQIRFEEDRNRDRGTADMALRFPFHPAAMPPILERPYSEAALRILAESPVRNQLAEALLSDATAVFLFLESGRNEVDRTARKRLRDILAELEVNLELPFVPLDPTAEQQEEPPRPRFPIIDVDSDDPNEELLRTLLIATEHDLATFNEPMVFPVFGRGRALYAIVGRGINRDVLIEACLFMTGPCSCQVKAQNPGVDLLLRADWARFLERLPFEEVELPPLAGVAPMTEAEEAPAAAPEPLGEPPAASATTGERNGEPKPLTRAVAAALAVAALAIGIGTVFVFVKQPRGP